ERRLALRDLHLRGRKAIGLGAALEPAGEEGLARAVLAAHRPEHPVAERDVLPLLVEGLFAPVEPDGEVLEAAGGHRPHPQGGNDLLAEDFGNAAMAAALGAAAVAIPAIAIVRAAAAIPHHPITSVTSHLRRFDRR